jgi:membrane-bound metal-dependent hydrolase YbcI (DUF457 family)
MTIPNHLALGLIIGGATGHYEIAVAVSVLLDCDHFIPLAKHGLLKNFKVFWKATTSPKDSFGDQRGFLHTIFAVFVTTFLSYFLFGIHVATVVGLSHFGHILLDAISKTDSFPFRPFSNFRVRGFVPYYSKYEILFFVGLMSIFLISFV